MKFLPSTRRLGLRARRTLSFALGAMLLSAILSITTRGLTREYLLKQRDDDARREAFANAEEINTQLTPRAEVRTLIASLPAPEGAQPVVYYRDGWYSKNLDFGKDALPQELKDTVANNQAATMRYYTKDGTPYLTIGIPIPANQAQYYEGVPLIDIEKALDGLAISLL